MFARFCQKKKKCARGFLRTHTYIHKYQFYKKEKEKKNKEIKTQKNYKNQIYVFTFHFS